VQNIAPLSIGWMLGVLRFRGPFEQDREGSTAPGYFDGAYPYMREHNSQMQIVARHENRVRRAIWKYNTRQSYCRWSYPLSQSHAAHIGCMC